MHCRLLHPSPVASFAVRAELERAELEQLRSFCEWHGDGCVVAGFPCLVGTRPAEL